LLIESGANIESMYEFSKLTPFAHAVEILIDGSIQSENEITQSDYLLIDFLVSAGAVIDKGIEVAVDYKMKEVESYLLSLLKK